MRKRLLLIALAAAVAVSLGLADQSSNKVVIPVTKTSPTSGKQMFASYCAPCHGTDGKGNGPAAAALKVPPSDLTGLAKSNHGKFPDSHITAVLEFGTEVPAHGSAEMPIWGPILGKMNAANSEEKLMRISNLNLYIQSIQAK